MNQQYTVEAAVIASLVMRGGDEYIAKLLPEHFSNTKNKRLFEIIRDFYLQGKEISIVTVGEKFAEPSYITDIMEVSNYILGTKQELEDHIAILKKDYAFRKIRALLGNTLQELSKANNPLEIKSKLIQELENIKLIDEKEQGKRLIDVLIETSNWIEERWRLNLEDKIFKIYHLPDLQEITGGLNGGEMTVVAGRPGTGKTAFALDIALHAAAKEKRILFISREMSRIALGLRLFAAKAGIDTGKLKAGRLKDEDFTSIAKAVKPLSKLDIIIDTSARRVSEIRTIAKEMQSDNRLDLIIVDYLQLLQADYKADTREQEVAAMSRGLKEIANDLNVPVIVLAQLNRNAEGKKPANADLRESGAIEQDADNIWLLYAPKESELNGRLLDIYEKLQKNNSRLIELIISKHRNGPVGSIYMGFIPGQMRFFNFPKEGNGECVNG